LGIDPVTGVISGVPEQTGSFNVSVFATNDAGTGQGTMTMTVNPPDTQEIAVESPSGTLLRNGLDIVVLGAAPPVATLDKTFSIRNIGAATLAGLSVSLEGADAADFNVHAQPSESVPPGGYTTFILRFQPGALGEKIATVRIVSNDVDENPFSIAVTATARLTFADWQAVKFTPAELNEPSISGPTADAESDGLLNEMEYVLGLEPKSADGPQSQVVTEGSNPSQYLAITFSVPEWFAEDATLFVEEAPVLAPASNWTVIATKSGTNAWVASNGGVVDIGVPSGRRVPVTVRSALPIGSPNERGFMRLRAMMP
jgi:hypothetical protein